MDPETEARLRAAAADAITPHHRVIIPRKWWPDPRYRRIGGQDKQKREHPPGWSPRPVSKPRAPRDLPEGVYFRATNGNGRGVRQRPYWVQVSDDGQLMCLGYFESADVAATYRAWVLQRRANGEHWHLTSQERRAWEEQTYPPARSYRHVQDTPALVWTIVYRLSFQPKVTVVDALRTVIYAEVEFITDDTIRVHFSEPMAGEAYLS